MNKKSKYIKYLYQIFVYTFLTCVLCSCAISHPFTQISIDTNQNQSSVNTNTQNLAPIQNKKTENTYIATTFTETFKATLEDVLDASLNHLSSYYMIENMYIEKDGMQSSQKGISQVHVIKASFTTNTPHHVLDCGSVKDEAILPDGTRFSYVYQGTDSPIFTMEKRNGEYKNASKTLTLRGEITLTIQEISLKKVSISVHTKYILEQKVIYTPLKNTRTLFRENTKEEVLNKMEFYTGETGLFYPQTPQNNFSAPPPSPLPIEKSVQCQAKSNIEESILNAIAKHLSI